MSQRRTDETVAYPVIGTVSLLAFNELEFPEPTTENSKYRKPITKGEFSAGGPTAYDDIEATRVYDPAVDDTILAALRPLQGDPVNGTGTISYHDAPGYVVAKTPIPGETYDIILLTAGLTGGPNTEGSDLRMVKYTFGINGVGR